MWKDLQLPELSTKLNLEGARERQRQKSLQRQSFSKYLTLFLVFMWNSALWEKLNLFFSTVFAIINKILILAGGLGNRLSFYEV